MADYNIVRVCLAVPLRGSEILAAIFEFNNSLEQIIEQSLDN